MKKRNLKLGAVLAVLLSTSLGMGGQAFAAGAATDTVNTEVTAPSSFGDQVIEAGLKYMGTPYKYASSRSTKSTMDCSEFTMWAYKEGAGIDMGKGGARSQARYLKANGTYFTDINQLQKGDLIFFGKYKGSKASSYKGTSSEINKISHVGIYMGDNKVLHTYSKKSGGVKITEFQGTSWGHRFLAGGRPY